MSDTLTERIKHWNKTKPNDIMQAFSSDLYEIVQRAESAEARAAELEVERMTIIETGDKLRDLVVQLRDERDTLRAQLAAEESAHVTDVDLLRRQIDGLQTRFERIRSEALEHFHRVNVSDVDTQAWLLDVAQDIEAMQIEAQS